MQTLGDLNKSDPADIFRSLVSYYNAWIEYLYESQNNDSSPSTSNELVIDNNS